MHEIDFFYPKKYTFEEVSSNGDAPQDTYHVVVNAIGSNGQVMEQRSALNLMR